MLFGGSVALLPLFAKSILHTGPLGLGVLRSAIAVGALIAGIRLAHKPLGGNAGRTLLLVVGTFGASMVVFGLSRWFLVSAIALAVSGFVDMFSMNIRSTTVALATPNSLRGRVNAVEGVFIGASNELGAFESGTAAALLGAVPAVVVGGALTIVLAVVWPQVLPRPGARRPPRGRDARQPPVLEKCCQSGEPVQRPPQSQPTERERAHEHAARDRHAPAVAPAVREGAARRRQHAPALEVGVLDRVDVDRLAVGVHRPAFGARRDRVTAVERRGVVGRHRAVVAAAEAGDRLHPADREPRGVETAKDDLDVVRHAPVDDERAGVRAAVEADERDADDAKLRRPHRAAGPPRGAELRGCHGRDRRVKRREGGHAAGSVLWLPRC